MATNSINMMTMMDQAKILDPSGTKLLKIVELLNRKMGNMLEEAPYMPANDLWTHKSVRAATLPTGSRRTINKGITPSTTRETSVLDVIGGFADYAEYDRALIDNSPDPAGMRIMKARRHIQGIGQSVVSDILYGDGTEDSIQGLAPRLDTIDSEFVWSAGGSGSDLTSVFVVTWEPGAVEMVYPKNMAGVQLGVKHEDKGQVTKTFSDSTMLEVYRDYFEVWFGLAVEDPRCIGRIANIETTGTTNIFDENLLIQLLSEMETGPGTRIYANQTIIAQARIRLKDKNNMHWTQAGQALAGLPILEFDGIPVRQIDKRILLNTEDAIS